MSTVAAPKARPAAAAASGVVGLALIGTAVLAVHDLAVARGWSTGDSWTGAVADRLDGTSSDSVAVVATAVVAIVVGLWAVAIAVKPARKTHRPASSGNGVWVTDNALTGLALRAAEETPGVVAAKVRTRQTRIAVTVTSDRPGVDADVQGNVRSAVDGLSSHEIVVKTEKVPHDA